MAVGVAVSGNILKLDFTGITAECSPPHSITLPYVCIAKHYLGGNLLIIVNLNCTEICYPKSTNIAENAVNLQFMKLYN